VRRSLRRSDEDPFAWKFFEPRLRLAEVGREHVKRIARDPHREIDGFVMACVETDQDAADLAADVLDGMAIALRDVADIALVQRLDTVAAVGTKQRDADLPLDHVLPLVRGWMPVELAQAARLQVEDDARDRLRDREPVGTNPPLAPALVDGMRLLSEHPISMSIGRRSERPLEVRLDRLGRLRAAREVNFVFREAFESRFRQAEVLRQEVLGGVTDPVGNAECPEFREVAVSKIRMK